MRTGIYGGTFNPIHLAHVHLVREFAARLQLDRVLLIPTGQPPHKVAKQLASNADRLEMLRLAAEEITECPVEISDIEMRREGRSYTADTLTELKAQYPEDELFLLMGEDMFMTVDRWYHPETIFAAATICGAPRDHGSFRKLVEHGGDVKKRFPAFSFIVQNIPYMEASSTEVREKLNGESDLSALLPESVERYIRERGLYGAEKEGQTGIY